MRSMSSSSPRPIRSASGRSSKRPVFFRTGLGTLASLGGRVPVLLTLRINLSSLALRGRSVTTTFPKMLMEFSGVATGVAAFESPPFGAAEVPADEGESTRKGSVLSSFYGGGILKINASARIKCVVTKLRREPLGMAHSKLMVLSK